MHIRLFLFRGMDAPYPPTYPELPRNPRRKKRRTYVRREKLPEKPRVSGSWAWTCGSCGKPYQNWDRHCQTECPVEQWKLLENDIEIDLLEQAAEAFASKSYKRKLQQELSRPNNFHSEYNGIDWEQG